MKTLVWVGSEVGPTFTSEKLTQDYDFSSGPVEVDDGDALELIRLVGRNLQDVSEFEALRLSSVPSEVDYAYIVAKNKVGLDAVITGPTSWSFKMAMGTASTDISTDTQLHGCVYMRAGGILVAKYSDGTDACIYTVDDGWLATDELIVVLYTDGFTIQLGIVDSGTYSWGTIETLRYPYEIEGFDGGSIELVYYQPLTVNGSQLTINNASLLVG